MGNNTVKREDVDMHLARLLLDLADQHMKVWTAFEIVERLSFDPSIGQIAAIGKEEIEVAMQRYASLRHIFVDFYRPELAANAAQVQP